MRSVLVGLAFMCILPASSLVGAATLTSYPDESLFLAALGPDVALTEENWDGFLEGTAIDTQVPGVTFSSPSAETLLQVTRTSRAVTPPAILSGGFVSTGGGTRQTIVADFIPETTALAFTVVAQHPEVLDIQMSFEFTDGTSQTIALPDNDGTNRNREFFGVTSDAPISRLTYTTNEQSGGLFRKFGGWDNLMFGAVDTFPPICIDEPTFRGSVLGVEVTCTDNRPGDTGISSVALSPDAVNVSLTVDPFTPPAPEITFFVAQINSLVAAEGTVTTADAVGNTDITPTNFRLLPAGVVINETLCDREGVELTVTNENASNPAGLAICSGSGIVGEPTLPFGYEPLPSTLVLTIDSEVTDDTTAELDVTGDFEPRMRGVFANSEDGGLTFSDFVDLTQEVVPGSTRVGLGQGKWSVVKYAHVIHAEICDGVDNDGDGLVDEGFEQPLTECVSQPVDPAVCDVDGDGLFVCGDPAPLIRSAGFVNVDCADQLDFVYPGAPELCNGIDDDCDGAIDDGDPGGGQSCPVDGQLGVCAVGMTSCEQSQIVCNQTTFPGSLDEVCDGQDNDCDGATDEADAVDAITWFADTDGDGFGDPASTQQACTQPAGFVADGTDCDDADPAMNPGASEVCDGLDNDCDGAVDDFVCVQLGGYLVEIIPGLGGEFPATDADGNSVFAYRISGQGALGQSCAGIRSVSHADILIPVCDPGAGELVIDILSTSPVSELLQNGQGDPSTDFGAGDTDNDVLKWDVTLSCQQVATVSLTAEGEVGSTLSEFLIKAGQRSFVGSIGGPGCSLP